MRYFLEDMTGVLAFVLAVALLPVLLLGSIYLVTDPLSCEAIGRRMGVPHEWGFWSGCMIEPAPGKWVQLDKYHQIETGK